ncbi:MAG: PorP/SprF family type IX secretion system membrane protein [Paludibacteraceae bacterium]|nr:PorP/SprF family type IX secretion system membrane protein [Paludibacteraceae bacterium]MBR5823265.1 PorP/SprF family type IX secretion system membrane protein [Paludibacteraceae bacterium]
MQLKKILFITFFSLSLIQYTSAQFDGIYSQYMHIKHFYNPAAIGEQELMKMMVAQRLDWIGIKNAPKTTLFTVNTPFKIGKTHHAAGIQFINDIFGVFANQQINAQYAYKFKFDYGTLSIGANIGVLNLICYGDSIKMVESDYHTENDPAIPQGTQSGIGFDLSAGIYFSNATWFAGVSILHAPSANIKLGDKYDFQINQAMTAVGGYNIKLSNPDFELKPSVLLYTDFISWQTQISLLLDYKNKFWGGLAYSIQDAISFSFGMEVIDGLQFGYCFDLPTSSMIRATHGSHELFLSYDFNIFKPKYNQKHKSVRLL